MKIYYYCLFYLLISCLSNTYAQVKFDSTQLSPATLAWTKTVQNQHQATFDTYLNKNTVNLCKQLYHKATLNEIQSLTKHHSPHIRLYAFYTLLHHTNEPLVPILLSYIHDTTRIRVFWGCTFETCRVGDFVLMQGVLPRKRKGKEVELKQSEIVYLDSVLLHQNSPLNRTQHEALNTAGNLRKWYQEVRKYAQNNSPNAIINLAKFKQEQDTSIILSHKSTKNFIQHRYQTTENPLYATIVAISYFPHPKFFSFLVKQTEQIQSTKCRLFIRALYEAIASYQTTEASKLLKNTFEQSKNHELPLYTALYPAINRFYTPLYDSLVLQLGDSINTIPIFLFDSLAKKYPQRVVAICKKSIFSSKQRYDVANNNNIDYESFLHLTNEESSFFAKAVPFLLQKDHSQSFFDLVVEGINNSKEQALPFFMQYLSKLPSDKKKKVNQDRLKNE